MTGAPIDLTKALPVPAGYVTGKSIQCRWVQATTPATNSGPIYIGGAEVAAPTTGYPLPSGYFGQLFPVDGSDDTSYYELLTIFAVGANGDVLNLLFG